MRDVGQRCRESGGKLKHRHRRRSAIRLALTCGHSDIDAFLDTLTPQQFDELLAFESLEGFGMEKLQHTMALGLSVIAQCLGAKVEWWQLVPGAEDPTETLSPDKAASFFRQIAGGAHGHAG